jgi:hypothetical protein
MIQEHLILYTCHNKTSRDPKKNCVIGMREGDGRRKADSGGGGMIIERKQEK